MSGVAGDITSFGSLLSLTGGGAGTTSGPGLGAGLGTNGGASEFAYEGGTLLWRGGRGGGGFSESTPGIIGGVQVGLKGALGSGGSGGTGQETSAGTHGGGGADFCRRQPVTVVPTTTYTVTIALGGIKAGCASGGQGIMLVEWWE